MTENNDIHFTAIAVISVNGIIAPETGKGVDWSSEEDQKWLHGILPTFDAAIMGKKTYDLLPKPLAKRNRIVLTRSVLETKQEDEHTWFFNPEKEDLIRFLLKKKWGNTALMGGSETYSFFLRKYWIDELWLTIEPIAFGMGTPLFSGDFERQDFALKSLEKLNNRGTLLARYTPLKTDGTNAIY